MNQHCGSQPIEIDVGGDLWAVVYSADCESIACGDNKGVHVWRTKDGEKTAMMKTGFVNCLAVSRDTKWIAAGTYPDGLVVWNAKTYEQVFTHKEDTGHSILGLDFSPDSTRLVSASDGHTATVWDVTAHKRLQTLCHDGWVRAAKYAPRGDRIATATWNSVRVWDSNDGRLLVNIPVKVIPYYNSGLLWSNNHLLVLSDGKIKQFDADTSSAVAEWPVPSGSRLSCIALPKHGEFIAYSTDNAVSFWDMSTHLRIALIQRTQDINSIVISPSDQFITISGNDGKVGIKSLALVHDSIPLSRLHPTLQEPDIEIDGAVLHSWIYDQLADADASLTTAIDESQDPSHHILASRALIRARLQHWDEALADAEMAISVQPSAIGYIAKSVAHVGKGERYKAYRTCDIALERFHSSHVTFLLLIKAIIVFMAGEQDDALLRVDDLIATVQCNSICYVVQAYMYLLLGDSHMEHNDCEGAIRLLKQALAKIQYDGGRRLLAVSLISGWKFDNLGIKIQQRLCEALHAAGRTKEAGNLLLKMANTFDEIPCMSGPNTKWVSDFTQQCLSTVMDNGNSAPDASRLGELRTLHATSNSGTSVSLLREWAKAALASGGWKDALDAAANFTHSRVEIYWVICERLETIDRIADAAECFCEMRSELGGEKNLQGEHLEWVLDFTKRSSEKLERLGDTEVVARRYDVAIPHYTAALLLTYASRPTILIKRSKAWLAAGSWEQALDDANQAITLNPSYPCGYEMKHAALHRGGEYGSAIEVLEVMCRMAESRDPRVQQQGGQYIKPSSTRATIRKIVQRNIRHSPRMLIDTTTGRLYNKSEQASAFESLPIFNELVSSTTTCIDYTRIKREVRRYFRYVMLSHTWEDNEPLFQHVMRVAVYDLGESPTHDKLQMFCRTVRDAGFNWAWSDTCCIDKSDPFLLQEALVAMFRWYQGSALMIVFLRGVRHSSPRGALAKSIWNTRAWTLQEYIATKVVRFYTEDWTLYGDLELSNHKESPDIILEMEQATGVPALQLMILRPGLTNIREKLCLASTRRTTRVEDTAYSLLGIFSAIGIPAIYGEGEASLGRLLANVLTRSGDARVLAWTGESSRFNTCLPARITAFNRTAASLFPAPITASETEYAITRWSHSPSFDLDAALTLYDRLDNLPTPRFAESRMTLPCIAFQLPSLSSTRTRSGRVYRTDTVTFGELEIKTRQDIARMNSLYLVHPWLDALLEHGDMHGGADMEDDAVPPPSPSMEDESIPDEEIDEEEMDDDSSSLPEPDPPSIRSPAQIIPLDRETKARRLVARLRQPFGGLLFAMVSAGRRGGATEYKRVAADSLITVRFQESVSLTEILDNVRIIDVL